MKYGTVTASRQIEAPRKLVYEAWTGLEHRRQWFKGPGWTEIERSVDLQVGGIEIAHGRFENGIEIIYTARFHLIDSNVRLDLRLRHARRRRLLLVIPRSGRVRRRIRWY